ncbi:MAG: Uma2 family endonuclease [Candidatus Eremiobacteraeota bacterium]|nr:Uma2 family endonuclease [Candidatus Eremiobacteraeota bacterium]
MALAMDLPELRKPIAGAVEIVPPHWIDDDALIELEERYEPLVFERFADGTLLVTPPAGFFSGGRNAELTRQVANWARAGDRGIVIDSSGGFNLPDRSLFAADTTFVARNRVPERDRTFPVIVPDAVFELMSQSDRVKTTMKKIRAYLSNGVALVVLIDPYRRRVYLGRAGDAEPTDLGDVERVDCSPGMPGFVLDVAAVIGAS